MPSPQMQDATVFQTHERFPRPVLLGALALVLLTMAAALYGRLAGPSEAPAPAAATARLEFRVADRADGAVLVLDTRDGHAIETATGENGFLRGILRSFARERRMAGLGPDGAFRLTSWADGRLTLDDLSTGHRIELEAFGSDNLAVFAKLLTGEGSHS